MADDPGEQLEENSIAAVDVLQDGTFVIEWTGEPDRLYQLHSSTNGAAPSETGVDFRSRAVAISIRLSGHRFDLLQHRVRLGNNLAHDRIGSLDFTHREVVIVGHLIAAPIKALVHDPGRLTREWQIGS